jgi:SOS-response transcriptional repressor LexA
VPVSSIILEVFYLSTSFFNFARIFEEGFFVDKNEDLLTIQLRNAILLENIRVLCVRNNTSIPKIEKALGYGNGAVSGWKKAKKAAPMERVRAIADYFSVTVESLINDGGTDEAAHESNPVPDDFSSRISALDEHGRSAVISILELEERRMQESAKEDEYDGSNVIMIRHYFSSPAAGFSGMEAGEDYEDIPLPEGAPRNADYCITVSGDSMEPYFPDGSIAYVLRDAPISDFDVGIFLVDGSAYIKQFCRGYGGDIYLLSANPARENANITIRADGNQRLEYRGKVIVNKKLPRPFYG